MAAQFKMATKTKFAFVEKKTLVGLKTFGDFDYASYRFWAGKKNWKFKMAAKI
jgi:hypothetical protein